MLVHELRPNLSGKTLSGKRRKEQRTNRNSRLQAELPPARSLSTLILITNSGSIGAEKSFRPPQCRRSGSNWVGGAMDALRNSSLSGGRD